MMTMMLAGCHRDKLWDSSSCTSWRREKALFSLSLSKKRSSLHKILEILFYFFIGTDTNTASGEPLGSINQRLVNSVTDIVNLKRYRASGLLPLNDCCRTSYRHASRFRTVAGSSSYALGSAFGTVRRRSDATGALLGTQVPTRGNASGKATISRFSREINRFFLSPS